MAEDNPGSRITYDVADFSAIASIDGGQRTVTIAGGGTAPTPEWTLTLKEGNEGIIDDPGDRHFDVVAVEPTGPVPEVLTWTPLTGELTFEVSETVTEIVINHGFSVPVT